MSKVLFKKTLCYIMIFAIFVFSLQINSFASTTEGDYFEMIKNGDIEWGKATGFSWRNGLSNKISVDKQNVKNGNFALKITGGGDNNTLTWTNNTIFQSVSVKENTDYVWSFWAKTESEVEYDTIISGFKVVAGTDFLPDSVRIDAEFLGNTDGSKIGKTAISQNGYFYPIYQNNAQWHKYTIIFNSGDNQNICIGYSNCRESTVTYLDDWKFYPVEEFEYVGYSLNSSNYGFENGVLQSFALKNGSYLFDEGAYQGDFALRVTSGAKLSVSTTLLSSISYEWKFAIKFASGNGSVNLGLTNGNSNVSIDGVYIDNVAIVLNSNKFTISDSNWHICSVIFDANSGDTYNFAVTPSSGGVFLTDSWQFNATPLTITTECSDGGRISGEGMVAYGGSTVLKLASDLGYEPDYAKVNGNNIEIVNNTIELNDVTTNCNVNAVFKRKEFTVATDIVLNGRDNIFPAGSVTGAGTYYYGDSISLVATPYEGYSFYGWFSHDYLLSTNHTYTTVACEDLSLYAQFISDDSNMIKISFADINGKEIASEFVNSGTVFSNINLPDVPNIYGYEIVGWSVGNDTVMSQDTTVLPMYNRLEIKYTVSLGNGAVFDDNKNIVTNGEFTDDTVQTIKSSFTVRAGITNSISTIKEDDNGIVQLVTPTATGIANTSLCYITNVEKYTDYVFSIRAKVLNNVSTQPRIKIVQGSTADTGTVTLKDIVVTADSSSIISSTPSSGYYNISATDEAWHIYNFSFNSGDNERITLAYSMGGSTSSTSTSYIDYYRLTKTNMNEKEVDYNEEITVYAFDSHCGKTFKGWNINGSDVCFEKELSVTINEDVTLIPLFEETVEKNIGIYLVDSNNIEYNSLNNTYDFKVTALSYVPESYQLVEQGIIFTDGDISEPNEFTLTGFLYTQKVKSRAPANKKIVIELENIYIEKIKSARAYLIVKDSNNNILEYYSDIVGNTGEILTVDCKEVVTSDFEGASAIYHCFTYMPDSTGEVYTEEEAIKEFDAIENSGVTLVRTKFDSAWCWDGTNDQWDWDGTYMSAVYKWLDAMKERDIDVCLNMHWSFEELFFQNNKNGLENPIYTLMTNKSSYDEAVSIYSQWVTNAVREIVINRGYENVKYLILITEPNHQTCEAFKSANISVNTKEHFDKWHQLLRATDTALENAGLRSNIKIVGPNSTKYCEEYLDWAIAEANDCIDIYSCHIYAYFDGNNMQGDIYNLWAEWANEVIEKVKAVNKPFWCDEFNINITDVDSRYARTDTWHGTQLAVAEIAMLNSGVSRSLLWTMVSQKWPSYTQTVASDSWYNGVHYHGILPYLKTETLPNKSYYAYALIGKYISMENAKILKTGIVNGLYMTVVSNGTDTTVIVVNPSDRTHKFNIAFNESINCDFWRYSYDYNQIVNDSTWSMPNSDKEYNNVYSNINDEISSGQVMIYSTVTE